MIPQKKLVMHASKYVVHNFSICIFREYSREVYFDDWGEEMSLGALLLLRKHIFYHF